MITAKPSQRVEISQIFPIQTQIEEYRVKSSDNFHCKNKNNSTVLENSINSIGMVNDLHLWPKNTFLIASDSMLRNINSKRLSKYYIGILFTAFASEETGLSAITCGHKRLLR